MSDNRRNIKVVSAFPGMGKSYYAENVEGVNAVDLDSSSFSWIVKEDGSKERKPNWTDDYIQRIKELISDDAVDIIFVSSHSEVREALYYADIPHYVVYPDESLKEAYLKRYRDRGNQDAFVKLLDQNWQEWIERIDLEFFLEQAVKIKVKQDVYITDIFKKR